MTMAEMERKLESLEKRVQELESRRALEIHYHTHGTSDMKSVQPFQLLQDLPLFGVTCTDDVLSRVHGGVNK